MINFESPDNKATIAMPKQKEEKKKGRRRRKEK